MPDLAQDSRLYEMMFVVTPTVADEGLQPVVERVSGYVTTQNGAVASVKLDNPWGRRRLAYQIQDFRDAFYVLMTFEAGPNAIVEIDRDIKLDQEIIRHLIVRYDQMTEHVERAPRHATDGPPPRRTAPPEQASAPRPEPVVATAVESDSGPAPEPDSAPEPEPETA